MNEPLPDLLRRARTLQRAGRQAVACLVINARGSTPQTAGALMLVDDAMGAFGTIGGGCVEAEVRRRAFELLSRRGSAILRFKLDHDYGWDDGLICGGTIELAVAPLPAPEVLDRVIADLDARVPTSLTLRARAESGPAEFTLALPPRERLYIAGAGHVGQALARLALGLDFDVTMFDDRADLLAALAPAGVRTVSGDIAPALAAAPVDGETYCVIVTRGHRHDEQALASVVGRNARYVGMIGSRRKVKLIFDDLRAAGVAPESLASVHAPIGVAIGSVTVEEIALSIAAELVQVRRERPVPRVLGPNAPDGARICPSQP